MYYAVADEITLCKLFDQRGLDAAFGIRVYLFDQRRIREGRIFQKTVYPVAVACVFFSLYQKLEAVGKSEPVDLSGLKKRDPFLCHPRESETLEGDSCFFHLIRFLMVLCKFLFTSEILSVGWRRIVGTVRAVCDIQSVH